MTRVAGETYTAHHHPPGPYNLPGRKGTDHLTDDAPKVEPTVIPCTIQVEGILLNPGILNPYQTGHQTRLQINLDPTTMHQKEPKIDP